MGRVFDGAAAALTSGRTHHELLLIQVGDAPGPPSGRRRGLYHIGIKVGDSLDVLRAAKQELERAGIPIDGMSDRSPSVKVSTCAILTATSGTLCGRRRVSVEK